MRTNQDPEKTYSQTEAAVMSGVTQRTLVDRGSKRGYLSKLYHCFPGQFWELVAVGSLKDQSKIRLTQKGVEELKELIQNLSPEPPFLDSDRHPIRENGSVVKMRLASPKCTLDKYAESVWFLNQIDGAGEHHQLNLEQSRKPTPEKISQTTIEAELVESGEMVTVSGSSGSAIEQVFEALECMDSGFWSELERRRDQGKLQGRLLKAVELKSRTEGEAELETEYLNRVKEVANKRKMKL
ncbi:MAG: hypothetical protein HC815_28420 [Richelia sp. RM1_1_1]|nr:hypothetical protein [Richelia sp. RM1_1_1]